MLDRHRQTRVKKFVKIKTEASIYDRNLVYFSNRLSQENPRINSLKNLFKKQKYLCPHYGFYFLSKNIVKLRNTLDIEDTGTDKG